MLYPHIPAIILALALGACDIAQAGTAASPTYHATGEATPPPRPAMPPSAAPQPGDLPPCPGINPDIRRPPGSNCLGITLDQCGADKAQVYVGREGTPQLRARLEQLAVSKADGNFRWIPYMTPVIEDLRNNRFNVELDEAGKIARIECY